jgi:hypothetical protein
VTEHGRHRDEIVRGKQQVSVTKPGRLYVYENLTPDRRGDVHILEVESATDSVHYKRLHTQPLQSHRTEPASRSGRRDTERALCRFEFGRFF